MYIIKKFSNYLKEAVSGTELIGPVGPSFGGDGSIPNNTFNKTHTDLIYCDIDGKFYSLYDFNILKNMYLKKGGLSVNMNFDLESIEEMLVFLNKK